MFQFIFSHMPSPRDAVPSGRYVSHGRRCPTVIECVLLLLVILIPLIDGGTGSPDAYGTSLYKLTDVDRKTWTYADRIELQCRKSVGLLIPGANFTDGDGAGVRFLQYFDAVKAEAKKIVSSVARKRAMIAVVDALGGYLHTKLLPHVREQYYAGRDSYSTVKRLHDLDKNIKYILGTDGRGWARPIASDQRSSEDVSLAMWRAAEQKPRTTTVRPGDESSGRCGGVAAGRYGLLGNDDPVPCFDNDTRPHSVVVPWRQGRTVLYGVRDAGCHRTLFDHLATATAANVRGRSAALRQWLDETVLPLVTARAADRWYPALWGATLVARRPKDVDAVVRVGDRDGRGHRLQVDCDWTTAEVPGHDFYAAIVLVSAYVCWSVALIIALYPTGVQL